MQPKLRWILLAALTLAAALLRGVASGEPLWLDELHTSWSVAGSWADVIPRSAEANQSPLFYLLLYPLVQWFGHDELVLRLPSLLAATLLVPLMFVAARRLTGDEGAAWLAALLVAVDRDCLFYGHEARPYAWVQWVGLWHVLVFYGLLRAADVSRRLLFIGGGLLLFYLHYTASLLLVAELAALLALQFGRTVRPAYRPWQMLTDLMLVGLLCLPAAGQLVWIAGRRQQWGPYVPKPGVLEVLGLFRAEVTVWLPLLVLGFTALLAIAARGRWWKSPLLNPPKRFTTVTILAWLTVPPVLTIGATWLGIAPLALVRYAIVSAVAPIAFAAHCLAMLRPRLLRGSLALLLLVLVPLRGGLPFQLARDGRLVGDRNEDWRGAVAWINESAEPSALVLLCSGSLEDVALRGADADAWRDFCRFPVEGIYALRNDLQVEPLPTRGDNRLDATRRRQLIQAGGGWWLVRGDHRLAAAVTRDARQQLAAAGRTLRIDEQRPFGKVTVMRIRIEGAGEQPRRTGSISPAKWRYSQRANSSTPKYNVTLNQDTL